MKDLPQEDGFALNVIAKNKEHFVGFRLKQDTIKLGMNNVNKLPHIFAFMPVVIKRNIHDEEIYLF